jgi:S1-C subfamily serine protease
MIVDIAPGSAAAKAALQRGDVITAVDNRPVVSSAQLRTRIGLLPVGTSVELEILRNNSPVKIIARIEQSGHDCPSHADRTLFKACSRLDP